MPVLDKRALLAEVSATRPISIELGCGPSKRDANAIGIDALDFPGVDLVGDIFEVLAALPAGSVRHCYSSHFLEHVADLPRLIAEFERILAPGGEVEAKVPHFSNPYFYSDPTHSRFFGLYSLSYFAGDAIHSRKVPTYGREIRFDLVATRLEFDSPFPLRGLFKRLVGRVFDSCNWMREFWEENLCYLFPCYSVCYRLRRR
ncbi:methyltransferase domain-containing protein [Niveibacterium sp. SC-1]|uniref:methyltransferase domain-containing protein n=1 Tax=Niveibacterium sp. SC-1 TaxID=3135646 RepID=UPI00311E2668